MNYLNTETDQFGLTINDVRAAHPETSVPDGVAFGAFVPYEPTTLPAHNVYTHEAREILPESQGGALVQRWEVVPRQHVLVPPSVTRRQARQALMLAGLLDSVPAAIAAIPDPVQRGMAEIEWADSQAFERDRQLLIQLGVALGLDSAALDNLFIQAAKL